MGVRPKRAGKRGKAFLGPVVTELGRKDFAAWGKDMQVQGKMGKWWVGTGQRAVRVTRRGVPAARGVVVGFDSQWIRAVLW